MPSLTELKRKGYALQRTASLGAAITLVSGVGKFVAHFECATKCAEVLGNSGLDDIGDGVFEVIPRFKIATEDLSAALTKLNRRFSVALVDYICDKNGGRFVALCRLNPTISSEPITPTPSTNLDDY